MCPHCSPPGALRQISKVCSIPRVSLSYSSSKWTTNTLVSTRTLYVSRRDDTHTRSHTHINVHRYTNTNRFLEHIIHQTTKTPVPAGPSQCRRIRLQDSHRGAPFLDLVPRLALLGVARYMRVPSGTLRCTLLWPEVLVSVHG
ncbi:uncharacterized protein CCOS01_02935 [Colletotrichum costaricense]|uniref:Uncharacterized protein n=1 Tax=Colletotrichum costaricense TaxID=1209916 RepID=A0AAI9Z3W5_9PEZI|nr:uncharacterized protein CCOS01_02935 [Colletotrichum costaricense]KAI3552578.1 hypothetical protein CSPX01_00327 [Colletotrichum filicis]KAK1534183.1 hypothetical protein CCOS01_02935 [Colletotrichum costaricense]